MLRYLRKNMKIIMLVVAAAFILTIFYGLGSQSLKGGEEKQSGFVKVNGREIDSSHYSSIYNRLRNNFPAILSPTDLLYLQSMAVSQTIDFTLMLQDAKKNVGVSGSELNQALEDIARTQKMASGDQVKRGLQNSKRDWNEFKKSVRDELVVQKMVMKKRQEPQVKPEDLREIRCRHILLRHQKGKVREVKERAQKIYEMVKKGDNFAALAGKYSEDPGSKSKGGDLGYFTTGSMVKPFSDAAFKLKIGEISPIVKTDYGYHIIKLEDSRLRKIKGKDVEAAVAEEKQQKIFSEWMYNLKKDAKIEIEDPALKALDLRLKGKLNEAGFEYQKAIKANPRNPYLHVFLATVYEELKKNELAGAEYRKAIDLQSADPSLYVLLGDLYKKMGNKDLAISSYRRASMIAGDSRLIHEQLVDKFKKLGATNYQREELQQIIRINKKEAFEKELIDKQQKLKTK